MFTKKKPVINPLEEQREKLQELGTRLQEVRAETAVSLEKIAQKTRIPLRLLKAIEAGDLEALPEPVYIRGLIKQFAEALGLNGAEFVAAFPTELAAKPTRVSFFWRLPSFYVRPFHLYLFYIFLLLVSLPGLSNGLKQSNVEMSYEQPSLSPAVKPKLPPNIKPKPHQTATAAQKLPNKPVVVDVNLKNDCWLKVVVDGKTEFEGVLRQGTRRTWVADEKLTVRAGNAGGVMVTFNNQAPQQLGELGQVQEVTYRKPGVKNQESEIKHQAAMVSRQ